MQHRRGLTRARPGGSLVVERRMTRYAPSGSFMKASGIALVLGTVSIWFALDWAPAFVAVVLFFLSALLLLFVASRPPIEASDDQLVIGRRQVPWADIRRVDRTNWLSPLIVRLTLADGSRILLIYPGDLESGNLLLRHLRRAATEALIDGIPHRVFWGEDDPSEERRKLPSPRYRLLREEDEAEVERLYERLKTAGRLDSNNSGDEK